MHIIGVDFSGAKSDQHTWLARGCLKARALRLEECRAVSRAELTQRLADQPGPTVAALDFPFGVPQAFAQGWAPGARQMPEAWAAASQLSIADFRRLRKQFVDRAGEPKRLGDRLFPECYSPLHEVNPNMVPMTFYGMQLLHRLWPYGWSVPPLEPQGAGDRVLLEAMPGAALKALGLPYKGYKNGQEALDRRQRILEGLAPRAGLPIQGLDQFQDDCLGCHDALDAVVAAVTAALWARDPAAFFSPSTDDPSQLEAAQLEGWLYAPVFLRRPGPPAPQGNR